MSLAIQTLYGVTGVILVMFINAETNRRLEELIAENDVQKRALESELTNCGQLLADTYDRYITP